MGTRRKTQPMLLDEEQPKLAQSEAVPCPECKHPGRITGDGRQTHHWIGCSRITPEQQAAYDARFPMDNWKHRAKGMRCSTCMFFVPKVRADEDNRPDEPVGRCRRHAPTMSGWPVMKPSDWCGDHKLDEDKA